MSLKKLALLAAVAYAGGCFDTWRIMKNKIEQIERTNKFATNSAKVESFQRGINYARKYPGIYAEPFIEDAPFKN